MVAGSFGGMSSSTCAIVSFVSIWAASLNVIYIKKDHRHQFCPVSVQCNPCQLIPSVQKTNLRRSYFPVRAIRKSFPLLPLNSQYNADKDVVASVHHGWVRIVWPSSLPLPFSPLVPQSRTNVLFTVLWFSKRFPFHGVSPAKGFVAPTQGGR